MNAAVEDAHGFFLGLVNPALVPLHLMALLALGLLVSQQQPHDRTFLLLAFAVSLACGIIALTRAATAYDAPLILVAAAGLSGLLVAAGAPVPKIASGSLTLVTGVVLGLDSAPEEISVRKSMIMLAGTGVGACLFLYAVSALAAGREPQWRRVGVRVVGSWMAASAALVLALRIAR